MERHVYLATAALALSTRFAGCLGDKSTRGEAKERNRVPSECLDPDIGSPMAYEEFDYAPEGPPDRVEDEVVLLTTPEDATRYRDSTSVPEIVSEADFETQCGVIVERVLRGSWGGHITFSVSSEKMPRRSKYSSVPPENQNRRRTM